MSYSSTLDILYPFCTSLSIIATFILLFRHKRDWKSIKWLVISYLCLSHALFVPYLLRNDLIRGMPHFCKTGSLALLLYLPCTFLYVRSIFKPRNFLPIEWLHFLPVIFFMIDNSGFYFSSAAFKLDHFYEEVASGKFFMPHTHGFIFHDPTFRMLFLVLPAFYWLMQVVIMARAMKKPSAFLERNNNRWVKWILFYLSFQLTIYIMVVHVFLSSDMAFLYMVTQLFGIITSLVITFTLFICPYPGTLFRDASNFSDQRPMFDMTLDNTDACREAVLPAPVARSVKEARQPAGKALKGLTRKQVQHLKIAMDKILENEQPFLRHGYSLQDFANALSYPWYQVSALINQEYGMHFNDFINKRRIRYACRIIKNSKYPNLNINGLADKCGFSNRNSFSNAFKKFTGLSPSEYLKKSHS